MGPIEVGEELKRLRLEQDETLESIADAIDRCAATVWKVENPKPDRPLQPAAHLVAKALGHKIETGYELRPLPRRRRAAR